MRKRHSRVLVLAFLFGGYTLRAQELVAHIRGTVTDPSGARVPVEIVATNTATKISTTVTSSAKRSVRVCRPAGGSL